MTSLAATAAIPGPGSEVVECPAPATSPGTEDRVTPRPGRRRRGLHWLGTLASWVITVAAGIVVLGLLAITVGPRVLPYEALVVRSGSMSPTIPTGSVVFYHEEAASQIKVGQIIVFNEPGNPHVKVTHRVHALLTNANGRYFITKGDANATPDDWEVPAVGTGWVAGWHVSTIGYALVDLESTTARLLLLVVPAALLGLISLYELWRRPDERAADEGESARSAA